MLSDMKSNDWLIGQVAAVGRCYELGIELLKVPSEMVNNFSILNHRPAKFGMGDDYNYVLLYRGIIYHY